MESALHPRAMTEEVRRAFAYVRVSTTEQSNRRRGRREEGTLVHKKEVSLGEPLLVDLGLIDPRRPGESRRRIQRALDCLVALGVLSIQDSDYSNVTLLPAFFHERPGR